MFALGSIARLIITGAYWLVIIWGSNSCGILVDWTGKKDIWKVTSFR